eukprot:c8399_g1_i1.p1 GENE.c8399_g1_i1~~c8399_g1_i1.p1  ORF type:complete len:315 (+),score=21.83 c8399_g1_i1:1-945(+)
MGVEHSRSVLAGMSRGQAPVWPSSRPTGLFPLHSIENASLTPADSMNCAFQTEISHSLQSANLNPDLERRVTLWHKLERRKISGNAAPKQRNLYMYLMKNPQVEVYRGQDGLPMTNTYDDLPIVVSYTPVVEKPAEERHVTVWNKIDRRKVSGNAAPLERNLRTYLMLHPEMEVFSGQDQPNYSPSLDNNMLDSVRVSSSAYKAKTSQNHLHTKHNHNHAHSFNTKATAYPEFDSQSHFQFWNDYQLHETNSPPSSPGLAHHDMSSLSLQPIVVCEIQPQTFRSPVSLVNSQLFLSYDASLDRLAPHDVCILEP